MPKFRQNYLGAWQQKRESCIHIVVKDETFEIPIPAEANDEIVLRRLRMFYRMIYMESGIAGLVLPRILERVDCIEVCAVELSMQYNNKLLRNIQIDLQACTLGRRKETLQLGRCKGRLTSLFENPESGKDKHAVANQIHNMQRNTALGFRRSYDLNLIYVVIATPPLASIIFAVI